MVCPQLALTVRHTVERSGTRDAADRSGASYWIARLPPTYTSTLSGLGTSPSASGYGRYVGHNRVHTVVARRVTRLSQRFTFPHAAHLRATIENCAHGVGAERGPRRV